MSELKNQKFKLGNRVVTIVEFFNSDFLEKLKKKYDTAREDEFWISLRELIRYLHLTCYAPHGLFFPGTRLMDDLWHSLITETQIYQDFCHKLRPGKFIHHSGIKYDDYTDKIGAQQIRIEESSWLASYISAFGNIDEQAFECLLLAKAIAKNMNLNLSELNNYGQVLLQLNKSEAHKLSTNFNEYVDEIFSKAQFIDGDRALVKMHLKQALHSCHGATDLPIILTPVELEMLYGASTALAFCLAQHLAAVERLSGLPDWQSNNSKLWEEIANAEVLCGLATTHLAKPGGSSLVGVRTDEGYSLSGCSAWVCGFEIFNKLVIGFETEDSIVFCLVDFPHYQTSEIKISVHEMVGLNGMGTMNLEFDNYFVPHSFIISSRLKQNTVPANRGTKYIIPEIGIAKRAILEIKLLANTNSPKHKMILDNLSNLEARLSNLEDLRHSGASLLELIPIKDEVLRDSVRLLSIAAGASTLMKSSTASRMSIEVIFLENPVQPPGAIEARIKRICKGSYEK